MYPEDCVQSIIGQDHWWTKKDSNDICRGELIFSYIPHFDQTPYTFEPIGRKTPTEHTQADVKVKPLKVDQSLKQVDLPVAAMPLYKGEVWAAYKAKRRPCLVLGNNHAHIDQSLTRGMPKSSSAPTILVAPYFGANKDGTRAGYNAPFVERIRHCEYPQFMWDKLPLSSGPEDSILRLDQIQPIGGHYNSHKATGYKLSKDALGIIDDLIMWLLWGGIPQDSDLLPYKDLIKEYFYE